jgi:hypothetical protein
LRNVRHPEALLPWDVAILHDGGSEARNASLFAQRAQIALEQRNG